MTQPVEPVALLVARIVLLSSAMIVAVIVGVMSAMRLAGRDGNGTSRRRKAKETETTPVERLRLYIQWGSRSEWGRKDLVGRLRRTLQKLYHCTPPEESEIAQDEAALEALLKARPERRPRRGTHPSTHALEELICAWEGRIKQRPDGGDACPPREQFVRHQ